MSSPLEGCVRRTIEDAIRCFLARHVVPDFALRPFAFERRADAHPLDSNRREHVVLNKFLVAYARELLDDAPQNAVAEVRVGVACAGIEIQRPTEHVTDDVARSGRTRDAKLFCDLPRAKHRIETLVAVPAAGVVKQLTNGDQLPTFIKFLAVRVQGVRA